MENENILKDAAAAITRLDGSNTALRLCNGFLAATVTLQGETKDYDRVFVHRAFPFQLKTEYVSLLTADGNEIGMIFDVADFESEAQSLLLTELERKYYEPRIGAVLSLKERYGFSYWQVKTDDDRMVNFTMQDTFRNIIRIGDDKAILLDVDGNRFVIESIAALDRKSLKKIEIYL